ncbi:hypothetical protein [Acinetobacter sichuanensis]|uniref:hypothetical protein n=1 Tax=Acinetobacter sichuanensis TaxID=2136183 RepID=UPI002810D0E0|nr:hypothetical protein [Acinetobacter sichuanensis]
MTINFFLITFFTSLISIYLFQIMRHLFRYQTPSHNRLEISQHTKVFFILLAIAAGAIAIWILTGHVEKNQQIAAWVICGLFAFLANTFLFLARNWYIELHENCVVYNRGVGRDRTIYFHEITKYRHLDILGKPHMRIYNQQGWKIDIPFAFIEQHPLMYWIDLHKPQRH